MTHLGHDILQKLNLVSAVSMVLLLVIFFILQYIFDMDFVCSCRPGIHPNYYVYVIIPPVILTWVVYITEPFHQARIFSFFRSTNCNKVLCFIVELLISYVSLGALWIASILFDGDWYICLKTNLNANHTGIPCKSNLTYEENLIKAGYKIDSLDIGLGLIGGLIVAWSLIESITSCCNRKKTWKRGPGSKLDMLRPPYYRKVYEGLLAEQVNEHLKKELTRIAAERAKAICLPYLLTIENLEQLFCNLHDSNNSINNTVLEAWKKISAPDFPFTTEDLHFGAETEAEGHSTEERNSTSSSSDRCLIT